MINIKYFIQNPRFIVVGLLKYFGQFLSDKQYTKLLYWVSMGKSLNLESPQTYNEKLNWLKLYDHNPLYTTLVDKYAVKEWVAAQIGEEYIIPTLGVWNKVEDIEWDLLPNQFVLKTTHGGGGDGVYVCKDKTQVNRKAVETMFKRALNTNPYKRSREWPYKNVVPRIIAEKYMEDTETQELRDYKFFAFAGEVKAMFIASERQKKGEEVKFDYYDVDFNHLDLRQNHPMSGKIINKPARFELMKELASTLSRDLIEVRCDFYEVNGKVYFGEMTFFHHGAVTPFHPESWDYEWGSWIKLPVDNAL